jgi:hypothetical protein
MTQQTASSVSAVLVALRRGFGFSWTTVGIIVLVCAGIATFESIDDMRPYWHPFVTVELCGLAIAYCVNVDPSLGPRTPHRAPGDRGGDWRHSGPRGDDPDEELHPRAVC